MLICMVPAGLFDKLCNAEVDDVVICLYIRSDRLTFTLKQHYSYEGSQFSYIIYRTWRRFTVYTENITNIINTLVL